MMMIEFRLQQEELGIGDMLTVTPWIDGVSLVELARRIEAGPAAQGGEAELAGRYAGLVLNDIPWQTWHTDGYPQTWFKDGDSCVLGCICGDTGCWPLCARITFNDREVAWSDFQTGHRSWNLAGLGPFRFDRYAYEHALRHPIVVTTH